jgi:hypothetical protein
MFKYRKLCLVRVGKFYGVIDTPTGKLTMDGQELCVGDCVEFGFEDRHDLRRGLITEVNGYFRIDGNERHYIPDDTIIIRNYMDLTPGDKIQYSYGIFKVKRYKENRYDINRE